MMIRVMFNNNFQSPSIRLAVCLGPPLSSSIYSLPYDRGSLCPRQLELFANLGQLLINAGRVLLFADATCG